MISLTNDYRNKVRTALLALRENFTGTDTAFSKQHGINNTVFSRIKTAENLEGLIRDPQWLDLGMKLNVTLAERKWKAAVTDVYRMIEEDVAFCQTYAKSALFVDDCGIGKTFTGKHLSRTRKNCFYVDARQGTTKQAFVRLIARTVGVDATGRFYTVKERLKYALKALPNPVVIIDEAGAPCYEALMELLEFWNATEGSCGWYLMGADGLRSKVERGMNNQKPGFAELFSRFSERFNCIVPAERQQKIAFYKKLITDVLTPNMEDKGAIPQIVNKCLTNDSGRISGLRRAESLAILFQNQ